MTSNHGRQNGNFKNLFEQNYLWDIILKHAKWRTQTSPTQNPGIIYLLEEISEVMVNLKMLLDEFYQIGIISDKQAFKVPKLVKKLIGLNDQEKLRFKEDTKLPHNLIFLQSYNHLYVRGMLEVFNCGNQLKSTASYIVNNLPLSIRCNVRY